MYFVIELSKTGNYVLGNFNTKHEAERKIDSLRGRGDFLCDYYVTKIVSN